MQYLASSIVLGHILFTFLVLCTRQTYADALREERESWHNARTIKKMSDDAGEKFWPDNYFDFGASDGNSSAVLLKDSLATRPRLRQRIASGTSRRNALNARDFRCPENTNSCSSVGSDLCCPSGQNCVMLAGGVGCCPSGQTCGGIAGCDTASGYTECPNSPNGGCCIPGARCEGIGCVFYGTSIVLASSPSSTVMTTSTSTASSSPMNTVLTRTVTVTQVIGGQITTVISATTVFTQSTSISGTASAPIRPTSMTTDTAVTGAEEPSSSSSTVPSETSCPTGYYMCSAVYLGGCCRVDRNCDTTSCPSGPSRTVVSSAATVLAPASSSIAGQKLGSCANGWFSCAASAGGGCCPSGYLCGTSCTATSVGQENTGKMAPEGLANLTRVAWSLVVLAVCSGVGMLIL